MDNGSEKYPIKWGFYVFMTLSIFIFFVLGGWQIYRLEWKEKLIIQRENALRTPAKLFEGDLFYQEYSKLRLEGHFDPDKLIMIPAHRQGQMGCDVYTPFNTVGKVVIVFRGWIKLPCEIDKNHNKQFIEGWVKYPQPPQWYMAKSKSKDGKWQVFDFKEIVNEWQLDRKIPFYIQQINDGNRIRAITINTNLPNNHLYYAIFWFIMGIIVFVLLFISYKKKRI